MPNAIELKPLAQVAHERQLWEARYSPCGRFLCAAGYDGTVQRWEVSAEQRRKLPPLTGYNGWVQCLAFDLAGERLFAADSWGQLACWDYTVEEPRQLWANAQAHGGWIRSLAVSPDSRLVASASNDRAVRLWKAESGQLLGELPEHPQKVFSVAFHPDGRSLVTGDLHGQIRQWDIEKGALIRQFQAQPLYRLDNIQECGGARRLVFDPSGTLLACCGQKNPGGGFATGTPCVMVFDWQAGQAVREMAVGGNDDGFAYDAQFHPAGFVMGVSCAFPGKGHVWFWKPADDKAFYQSNKIPNGRSLSLHPGGQTLALAVSLSPNGNGRQLQNGQYPGGTAKIHFLELVGMG